MSNGRYKLDENGEPVEVEDLMEWARWMETGDLSVATSHIGPMRISTVFLGLDFGYVPEAPVLFETMIFGGDLDRESDRYLTRKEALEGHAAMVLRCQEALKEET